MRPLRPILRTAMAAVLILLPAAGIVSCDGLSPKPASTDINEAFKKGVDRGYRDGKSHKPKSPENKYSGNAHAVYMQGYNSGYAKGFNETEHEAFGGEMQEASFEVSQTYGHLTYTYHFTVDNGKVAWSFKGTGGNRKGSFSCNKDVPAKVVKAELSGLAYWRMASRILEAASTRTQTYAADMYIRHAKETLGLCLAQLIGIQDYCPNASQLPETCLEKLRPLTDGSGSDLSSAISLGQSMRNLTPTLCHLHGVDF